MFDLRKKLTKILYKNTIKRVKPSETIKQLNSILVKPITEEYIQEEDDEVGKEKRKKELAILEYSFNRARKVILPKYRREAVRLYNLTKNKTEEEIAVFLVPPLMKDNKTQTVEINKVIKGVDVEFRSTMITDEIGVYPFFVCSRHDDCADDHKVGHYKKNIGQGLLYYNEKFKDDEDVKKYIREYNLASIQEATGSPYYLGTRPYCRHYFEGLSKEEVLTNSYRVPHYERGWGEYQPLKRALGSAGVEANLRSELAMFEAMYAEYPTVDLLNRIRKYRLLIAKIEHRL